MQEHFQAVATAVRPAKDIHVAACAHALAARQSSPHAPFIKPATYNVRDFQVRILDDLRIAVMRSDAFLLETGGQDGAVMAAAFAALRTTLRSAATPAQLPERLSVDGRFRTAAA